MSVNTKRLDRSIIILLILGLVQFCFGRTYENDNCRTPDCRWTVEEYRRAIISGKRPCDDFYKFACNKERSDKQLTQSRTEIEYLTFLMDLNDGKNAQITPLQPSDRPLVQLLKRYNRLCEDEATLKVMGLKPIIGLLNKAASKKTWWELENWAVSIGLRSSFFSVAIENHWNRKDGRDGIILGPPQPPRYSSSVAKNLLSNLTMEGLKGRTKERLSLGQKLHFKIFETIQNPEWSDAANYGMRSLTPISDWHSWWNAARGNRASNLQQIDWENYLENYWKNTVILNGTIPLMKNGMFNQWIEYVGWLLNRGRTLVDFSDDDIKNAILWRIATEMVEYASQEARNILELPPKESCRTPAMNSELAKDIWYKKFPQSVRKPVQKIYTNIDLQTKLLKYKMLPKILPKNEPLSPRERRDLLKLYRTESILSSNVMKSEYNRKTADEHLSYAKYVKEHIIFPRGYDARQIKAIPELEKLVEHAQSMVYATKKEYSRNMNRIKSFEDKNWERLGIFEICLDTQLEYLIEEVNLMGYNLAASYKGWDFTYRKKLISFNDYTRLPIKDEQRMLSIVKKYVRDKAIPEKLFQNVLYYVNTKMEPYYKGQNLDYILARFGISASVDKKREALRTYVKDKRHYRFPFESMYTRPTLIIETPPNNANYVDLALSLKRWERGMLLQTPETFRIDDIEIHNSIYTFSPQIYADVNNRRIASLVYGSLGSAIGARLVETIDEHELDNVNSVKDCLNAQKKLDPEEVVRMSHTIPAAWNVELGLSAAWKALERNSAFEEKLFLLSFASGLCSGDGNIFEKALVNTALSNFPKFINVFLCRGSSPVMKPNKCMPYIPPISSHKRN